MPYGEKKYFFQMFLEHLPSYDKIIDLAAKPSGFIFQFCCALAIQLWGSYFGKILVLHFSHPYNRTTMKI